MTLSGSGAQFHSYHTSLACPVTIVCVNACPVVAVFIVFFFPLFHASAGPCITTRSLGITTVDGGLFRRSVKLLQNRGVAFLCCEFPADSRRSVDQMAPGVRYWAPVLSKWLVTC